MEYRKVEVFRDNQWKEIDFHNLKSGDKFRMFEPNTNEPVVGKNQEDTEFVATSDTFWDDKLQQFAIDIY